MDEIVQVIQEKTGLSQEQAQEVAQAVIGIITSKLPPEFQGLASQFLGTGAAQGGDPSQQQAGLGGILGAVSGLFGQKS